MFKSFVDLFLSFVYNPKKVFWLSISILFLALVVDGKVFQILSLYRQQEHLRVEIENLGKQTDNLKMQIREAKHPKFIEKKARNQLDLVEEGDLLFVFSD